VITRMRVTVAVAALVVSALGVSTPASAEDGHHDEHAAKTVVYILDNSTHGNPEGVAWDGRFFYVGATGDGTIYRGSLGDRVVHTFIAGKTGRAAIGLKVFEGRLYVAGGTTGKIFVYDLARPAAAPVTLETGPGGFLNDLVVTGEGDIYITDSFRPTLWHVAPGQVKTGGIVDAISVSPEIPYAGSPAFNLNGIVAFRGGHELLVVNSSDGKLYRIRFDHGGRRITPVVAPPLVGGDGMIVDHGALIVVRGNPASLSVLKLASRRSRATLVEVIGNATLRGPSTVAAADERYLVVNADFATSTRPFTVSGLPRQLNR